MALDQAQKAAIIAPAIDFYGASWGSDGTIVFGRFGAGLWQVPAEGGAPTPLTTLSPGDGAHRFPQHLPEGKGLLLTVSGSRSGIALLPRGAKQPKPIIESATHGRYIVSGHIVFTRDGLLMAVPFDLDRLATTGAPFALVADVMEANNGTSQFDVTPGDRLTAATYIHRVNTIGGIAPTTPCNEADRRALVPYEADYYFYRPSGRH